MQRGAKPAELGSSGGFSASLGPAPLPSHEGSLAVAGEERVHELRQVGGSAALARLEQLVVARALALVDDAEVARLHARRDTQRRIKVARVVVGGERRH